MVSRVLRIGSPCEYVLQVKYEGTGLPEGAAKHLLPIKEDAVRDNLCRHFNKTQGCVSGGAAKDPAAIAGPWRRAPYQVGAGRQTGG